MKHANLKSLDQAGLSHIILPLIAVVMVAVAGTVLLVSSHADTPTAESASLGSGTIHIKGFTQDANKPKGCASQGGYATCYLLTSRSDLHIKPTKGKGYCNKRLVDSDTNFHGKRTLVCTATAYRVWLEQPKAILLWKGKSKKQSSIYESAYLNVQRGDVINVNLGSGE